MPSLPPSAAGKAATRDSSAAMVAASGMIELAWASSPADRARYLAFVQTVLASAMTPAYQFTPAEGDAVLKNGTTSYPVTGVPIIYGAWCAREPHRSGLSCGGVLLGLPGAPCSPRAAYPLPATPCPFRVHCAAGDYYLLEAAMRWDATPQAWRQEALDYLAARGGRFFADPA